MKETVEEFTARIMKEARFDVDVEFCKKHNIKFSDSVDEDSVNLFDSKSNKIAFDLVSKHY